MYWWNYRKLAVALREGTIKPWQQFMYWSIFLIFLMIGALFYRYMVPEYPSTILNNLSNIIIPGIGTLAYFVLTYSINTSGDRRDYIKRMVCLSLPISVRILVIILFLSILGAELFNNNDEATEVMTACFDSCHEDDDACAMTCFHQAVFTEGSYLDVFNALLTQTYSLYLIIKAFRIASGKEASA